MASLALLALALPAHGQSRDLVAPPRFEHVVGRVGGTRGALFTNLLYESNNRSMRGDFDARPEAGCDNAARQREVASRVRGLFVLRDALFSQPDHPVEHRACALMLPANWITAAAADALAGVPLRAPSAPPVDDDAAWSRVSVTDLFGSFPASERLHRVAIRPRTGTPTENAQTANARHNLHVLAREAAHLIAASSSASSPAERVRAIAAAGAERIAESDRAYFTPELRRERAIVLGVEHPNTHELRDEGKGIAIWGRDVPASVLREVRDAVYRRRLVDGPVGIERYDLTRAADRRRAIEVVTALAPRGSSGHRIYLWVGGPLAECSEQVQDASAELPGFLRELRAAPIAHERVVVYNRPSFRLGRATREAFLAEAERFRALGLPFSVNANTVSLARAMGLR
jgi:hypothetical protein